MCSQDYTNTETNGIEKHVLHRGYQTIKYNLSLKHRENHQEVLFLGGGIKFLLSLFNVPTSLQ